MMPHYFDERPGAATQPGQFVLDVAGRALTLATDAGVFSRSRIDPGTSVLLRKAPPPPPVGNLLDLGCGYGPIALSLAVRSPGAAVWAIDVNERARTLVAENAALNGIDNVIVAAPDDVPAGLAFDAIYSNPPVRVGKDAMRALLGRWLLRLQRAATVPERDAGRAFLVVQRHLGADSLQQWLGRAGFPAERLASSKGYRVLVVACRSGAVPERNAGATPERPHL